MKKLLFIIALFPSFSWAVNVPEFEHKDPIIHREFENVGNEIKKARLLPQLSSSTLPSGSSNYIQNVGTEASPAFSVSAGTSTTFNTNRISTASTNSGVAIRGTGTNDSASQFDIGESSEATSTTNVTAGTSDTFDDLLSITLTPGDWDVSGMVQWDRNTATWTEIRCGFSTTSGDSQTGMSIGVQQMRDTWASSGATPNIVSCSIPPRRQSIAVTTTFYLKRLSVYSANTPRTVGGRITARRAR